MLSTFGFFKRCRDDDTMNSYTTTSILSSSSYSSYDSSSDSISNCSSSGFD